jgi:hypothetical protein
MINFSPKQRQAFFKIVLNSILGYGNIVPLTDSGKIFSIFIAVIGIPLNIVILAKIGNFLRIILNYMLNPIKKRIKNQKYFLLAQVRKYFETPRRIET